MFLQEHIVVFSASRLGVVVNSRELVQAPRARPLTKWRSVPKGTHCWFHFGESGSESGEVFLQEHFFVFGWKRETAGSVRAMENKDTQAVQIAEVFLKEHCGKLTLEYTEF